MGPAGGALHIRSSSSTCPSAAHRLAAVVADAFANVQPAANAACTANAVNHFTVAVGNGAAGVVARSG